MARSAKSGAAQAGAVSRRLAGQTAVGAGGACAAARCASGQVSPINRPLRLLRQKRIFDVVKIVFDPAKDVVNRVKHGVSLALAEILFAGPYVTVSDDRFDHGERREIGFGLIQGRLFACVFADRKGERRVISLRKANKREAMRYGEKPE